MLLLALALQNPALAFAPSQDVYQGAEPNRVYRYNEGTQARLRHQDAWEGFTAGLGEGWYARFDEVTRTPHRAWGPPIPLSDVSSAAAVDNSLREVLAQAGVLGVGFDQLALRSARHTPDTDTWYVEYDRLVGGVPVWRAGLSARVRYGALFMLEVDTYPQWTDLGGPQLSPEQAVEIAQLEGPASLARHEQVATKLLVLPWEGEGAVEPRLVWEVRSRTAAPLGRWVSMVDAQTGELLSTWNEIRFFSGTVYGVHDTRTVDGSYTTSPMPLMNFTGSDGGSATAGEDGSYTLDDDETWTMGVSGSYINVRNRGSGGNGSMTASGSAPTWDTNEATQAEIDSYKFLHDARLFGLATDPSNPMAEDRLTSNVNLSSTCNAYYDGSVNFYSSGGGCNNTGRIADVNYHEWGHGWHYYALQAGSFDGSVSEGAGDMTSAFLTKDPEIGPYFFTNGSGIREIAANRSYPDDVASDTHTTGLIWAGAVWDTWAEMLTTYGEAREDEGDAWYAAARAFSLTLRAGPVTEETYDEYSAADDDDGDLSNGTPHACEIIDGFAPHGLGPTGTGGLVSLDHEALGNQDPDVDIPVSGSLLNLAAACQDIVIVQARAVYSTDGGGSWTETDLSVSAPDFSGAIPALPEGTVVWYYLRALADDGTEVLFPSGGEIAPYSFYVGQLEQLYCQDFEADDGDYTHELLEGEDDEGADDWMWGRPNGAGGDPESAWSGNRVWGNDLGTGNYNGQYQSDVVNRLTSVPIDLMGNSTVVVQFRRWLQSEDGTSDDATVYANDVAVWESYASGNRNGDSHTLDSDWVLHTMLLESVSSPLSLAWEIDSDGNTEFGGWNIDDVCVYAPLFVQSAFSIQDFTATDDLSSIVTVGWTQPFDPRATDVVVVRRTDRYPESRDDGDVVYEATATPGSYVSFDDPVEGTYFYSVFAGGSDGWLSGAAEGANADLGTGLQPGEGGTDTDDLPGVDPDGEKLVLKSACGCSAGGPGAGVLALLGAVGLLVGRRRR